MMKRLYLIFLLFYSITFSSIYSQVLYNWNTYDEDNSALQTNIITQLEFINDVLWIGTDKGLYYMQNNVIYKEVFFPELYIKSLAKDNNQQLWIGTGSYGVYKREINGNYIAYDNNSTNGGLSNNSILKIAVQNDNVWVGTEGSGLFLFNNNTWQQFYSVNIPGNLNINEINEIYIENNGTLWLGTSNAGLVKKSGSLWISYSGVNGFSSQKINAIFPKNNTELWIGCNGNTGNDHLLVFNSGNESVSTVYDSAASNGVVQRNIWDIYKDSEGRTWIGPNNGEVGLTFFDDTLFYAYGEFENGLKSNRIYDFAEDDSGKILVATFRGISVNSNISDLFTENIENAIQASIYPNPLPYSTPLHVDFPYPMNVNIEIFNLLGKTISNLNYVDTQTILLQDEIPTGIYFIRISTENKTNTFKLLINQ
jgi:ligand-binding sensor domain-containing protein